MSYRYKTIVYNLHIFMQFFPKTPKFFDLFDKLAKKVEVSGRLLSESKLSSPSVITVAKKLRKLELEADDICHHIKREADATFIPPIDREDIHALAGNLDNIIDYIENLQSRIQLFQVGRANGVFAAYIEAIRKATKEIALLTIELRFGSKKIKLMRKHIIRIHELENEGDELFRKAYMQLFSKPKAPLIVIKWKDIYQNLEIILDECERTADTIDEIIIKNF